MRLTIDRRLAADLATVLEQIIHDAAEDAWFFTTCTQAQEVLRSALKAQDAHDSRDRLAA